ncbi:hypothetical protein CHARACLAT_018589, partial [Characodon lateralis]|nr:hypothetical protein [Characodon lateralis]
PRSSDSLFSCVYFLDKAKDEAIAVLLVFLSCREYCWPSDFVFGSVSFPDTIIQELLLLLTLCSLFRKYSWPSFSVLSCIYFKDKAIQEFLLVDNTAGPVILCSAVSLSKTKCLMELLLPFIHCISKRKYTLPSI